MTKITNHEIGEIPGMPPRKEVKDKPKTKELMSPERWKFECVNRRNFIPPLDYEWSQLEETKIKY